MVNGDDLLEVNEWLSNGFAFAQHPQASFTRYPLVCPVDGFMTYPQGWMDDRIEADFLHVHPSDIRHPVDFDPVSPGKSLIRSVKKELAKLGAF